MSNENAKPLTREEIERWAPEDCEHVSYNQGRVRATVAALDEARARVAHLEHENQEAWNTCGAAEETRNRLEAALRSTTTRAEKAEARVAELEREVERQKGLVLSQTTLNTKAINHSTRLEAALCEAVDQMDDDNPDWRHAKAILVAALEAKP